MRFLVTGVGGPAGAAVARQLSARGHDVVGADMYPAHLEALSAFELVPAAADPAMLEEIRLLAERYGVQALIPTVQDELPAVAGAVAAGLFPVPVVIGAPLAVTAAQDKYPTMLRLAAAGVPVPRFRLPSEFAGTGEALEWFGGPLVVKPRVGRGSRGVRVVHNAEELDWSVVDDSQILQEFAPGAEYAPMVHVSTATSAIRVGVVEKTESLGCWDSSGGLRALRPGDVEDVESLAVDAALGMGLTGPVDVDVRRLSDGTAVVLEVNARFGANSEHAPQILDGVLADLAHQIERPGIQEFVR
jgi:carbamoylphosphate synthase large subunit